MKLLLTTDTVGGIWTYTVELARALRPGLKRAGDNGHTCGPDQRTQVKALDNVRVYESEYRLEWMQDPWEDVSAHRGLAARAGVGVRPTSST